MSPRLCPAQAHSMAPSCWWHQLQAPLRIPNLAPNPNLDNPFPRSTREVLLPCAVSGTFQICSASTPIDLQCPAWNAHPPARYRTPRLLPKNSLFLVCSSPDWPLRLDYLLPCSTTSPELPSPPKTGPTDSLDRCVSASCVCIVRTRSSFPTNSALRVDTHGACEG